MIDLRTRFGCAALLALIASNAFAEVPARARLEVGYNRDIRPVLSDNCFACHGPDQSKRKGKLRLDVREEAIAKGAIVPGDPSKSELIQRIDSANEDELMPPPKSHKVLTSAEKRLLRQWVQDGARYEGHWSYTVPGKVPVPGVRHAVDFLVQQRLAQVGMEPSPMADRRTLARRLYLDLWGIPPTPDQVEAFEHDTTPTAYEHLIESLLAGPAYGERMAIGWLDIVRYADTIGYHSDNPRNVWPYRDYVIRAFNENKPFDRFTREQIAGDLLPGAGVEQQVASAFNRLLLTTEEGGAQPKDYEARMLTDRVRAVGAVWLGQTIGCAQCHDHKFDPITSRDFYSLGAFFADIREPIIGKREDGILVPTPAQSEQLGALTAKLVRVRQDFERARPEAFNEWTRGAERAAREEEFWSPVSVLDASAESGVKLRIDSTGVIAAEKDPPNGTDVYHVRIHSALRGIVGLRIEGMTSDQLPDHGPGRAKGGAFALSEVHLEDERGNRIELGSATATFERPSSPALAAVVSDGSAERGWQVDRLEGVPQAIYLALASPVDIDAEQSLSIVLTQMKGNNTVLGRFRVSATAKPEVVRAPSNALPPSEIRALLLRPASERSEEQVAKLLAHYRSVAFELAETRRELKTAQKAKDEFETSLPHCLVSTSLEKPRTVRVLPRGNWMVESGEIVQPALPAYLVSTSQREPGRVLTRLDLANWLVARENPLTARVVVNRLWKQFFGAGLSKVLDDFGAQGEPPPNQPLLDWLACEFMDSGWDVKHIVRLMVDSDTYRQVSTVSREMATRDPYNREFSRQSRWRLDAELVRDNVLSIAGLLTTRVGGPSVKPYQPDGYWENLNFPVRSYEASTGSDQHRRGLYTWWQRSFLHPSLVAFDAPSREECAADRSRSNIPQQALVLLNDPTYVEAARVFAEHILRNGGSEVTSRITWAFQQALSRAPRSDEMETLFNLLYQQLTELKGNDSLARTESLSGRAPEGLLTSEFAAWISVARVILNLHETITRS